MCPLSSFPFFGEHEEPPGLLLPPLYEQREEGNRWLARELATNGGGGDGGEGNGNGDEEQGNANVDQMNEDDQERLEELGGSASFIATGNNGLPGTKMFEYI
jgi:hypothetical protein